VRRGPVRTAAVASIAVGCLLFGGCRNVEYGATTINVRTGDWDEEKQIRRELWRIVRAAEDVKVRYGLTDIEIRVLVRDLGGLGQAQPRLNTMLRVDRTVIVLSEDLFLGDYPELDLVIEGLVAHEMAHALHYARMSTGDITTLGLSYNRFINTPSAPTAVEWVRAYERFTDMTAIAMGYGEALIQQKRASALNLARNEPPNVWDFYLTEDEIRAFMADRDALREAIIASIRTLNLPSLERVRASWATDAEGDARPARSR
jgi:hypothetical protein